MNTLVQLVEVGLVNGIQQEHGWRFQVCYSLRPFMIEASPVEARDIAPWVGHKSRTALGLLLCWIKVEAQSLNVSQPKL